MTTDRQIARAFGLSLEWRAALILSLKGYRVLARNHVARGGEIDIIALSPERWFGRGAICFVEVRGRAEEQSAFESVDAVKQSRIRRAARDFVIRSPRFRDWPQRFDVMAAGRNGRLVHTLNAFDQ